MKHAFPLVVRPVTGESGLSFVSRLADINGIPLIKLMRDIASLRNIDVWNHEDWEKLAQRSLLDVSAFDNMRQLPAECAATPNAVRFLGKTINPQYLIKSQLRICPACVAERKILRESWRLVYHVACSDHKIMLIDTCDCGRPLGTVSRGDDPFTCMCGKPFADNVAKPASDNCVKAAQWMIQAFGAGAMATAPRMWLVKGGRLGPPFSTLEPYDIMRIIDTIGQAATVLPEDDEWLVPQKRGSKGNLKGRRDLETSTREVEAAMAVMHDWPHAYHHLLEQVAGRNKDSGSLRPRDLFATRIGQLMLTPYLGADGHTLKPLQEEVDKFLVNRGLKVRQKIPARASRTAISVQKTMSCVTVSQALGINKNNSTLKRVYRETLISFDHRDDLPDDKIALGQMVLDEVKRRLESADDYMSPSATSEYLCHDNVATHSSLWVHPDLLQPVEPDRTVAGLIKGHAFLREDVERMRQKIAEASQLVKEDEIPEGYDPYSYAAKAGVDASYTGTDLLLDILSGTVKAVRLVEEPRLTDLYLDTAVARRRALERRVGKIIEKDQFAGTSWIEHVLSSLWPNRNEKLTIDVNRRLRAENGVRYQTKINTTEGRERPMYWYSVVDHMVRALKLHGPSASSQVDEQLMAIGLSPKQGHLQANSQARSNA